MDRFSQKFSLQRWKFKEIEIINNPIISTEIVINNLLKTKAYEQRASQENSIKQLGKN